MLSRSLRVLVSFCVFLFDRIVGYLNRFRRPITPSTCLFLTYHSIDEHAHGAFAQQMRILKRLARPLPVFDRAKLEAGCHYVGVTFDDAFRSFIRNAIPVLSEAGIGVLLFVPTGYLGRRSSWFDYGGKNAVGEEVISAADLRQLARSCQIEFGSHTVSHPNLVELSDEEVCAELKESRLMLEAVVGHRIKCMSFPYGRFTARELDLARRVGYEFCFCLAPQMVVGAIQPGLIGRVSVHPTDWPVEFKLKCLGAYRWTLHASAWKRKLIGRAKPGAHRYEISSARTLGHAKH